MYILFTFINYFFNNIFFYFKKNNKILEVIC
jgi:hypothetical protein